MKFSPPQWAMGVQGEGDGARQSALEYPVVISCPFGSNAEDITLFQRANGSFQRVHICLAAPHRDHTPDAEHPIQKFIIPRLDLCPAC